MASKPEEHRRRCITCKRTGVPMHINDKAEQRNAIVFRYMCRKCRRIKQKKYYNTKQGKKNIKRGIREYVKNNREKACAWSRLNAEIHKGTIQKPVQCEMCGQTEKRIVGHHDDYTKPLEVQWVCDACHKKIHSILNER